MPDREEGRDGPYVRPPAEPMRVGKGSESHRG